MRALLAFASVALGLLPAGLAHVRVQEGGPETVSFAMAPRAVETLRVLLERFTSATGSAVTLHEPLAPRRLAQGVSSSSELVAPRGAEGAVLSALIDLHGLWWLDARGTDVAEVRILDPTALSTEDDVAGMPVLDGPELLERAAALGRAAVTLHARCPHLREDSVDRIYACLELQRVGVLRRARTEDGAYVFLGPAAPLAELQRLLDDLDARAAAQAGAAR